MKLSTALVRYAWRRDPRLPRVAVGVAFAFSFALAVASLFDAVRFIGRPFPNFGYTDMRLTNPVLFARASPEQPEIKLWDRIESVDGVPVDDARELTLQLQAREPGTHVTLGLRELDGTLRSARVRLNEFTVRDFFRWHTNQTLIALVILAIGALVWARRSGPRVLTFCLTCIAFALMCIGGVDGTLFRRFPHLFHLAAPLVPAAGMAFAVTLSPRLARRKRGIAVWGVALLIGLTFAVLLVVANSGPPLVYARLGMAVYAWLLVGALAFFVVMLDAWRRPEGPVEGARAGVIVLTWPLAMGIPAVNFLLGFAIPRWEMTAVPNLFVLLIPFSVAYAIFRQDLFEADLTLRRLIVELLVTGLATAVYALALSGAYLFLADEAAHPAVAVALAALLLALAVPLRDRVRGRFEQIVEWRRYDAQEALAWLSASLSTELSLDRAFARLSDVLASTVQPSSCTVALTTLDGGTDMRPLIGTTPAVPPAIFANAGLVLAQPPKLPAGWQDPDDDGDVRLSRLPEGVEVIVPLRATGRDVGALVLGPPRGRRVPYSTVDLMFIRALAGQVAPALANARVFDEVDRLNRTLEERVRERTAELTAVNEELRDLDKRKDELISTISHDFRSPLSIIRSHVDTVMGDAEMDAATRASFLKVIDKQARRLSAMVENLLDLARIRNRGLSARTLDVGEVLRLAADTARPRMDGAGLRFYLETPAEPVSVHADLERLGQVFQNLLDNAAKFTARGGEVRLAARVGGGAVRFVISDTGIGIPLEDQTRICEAFYQVKRAGAEREGSGLGLAIVKEIVERHGSTLQLSSGERGTTWEFAMPVHRELAAAS